MILKSLSVPLHDFSTQKTVCSCKVLHENTFGLNVSGITKYNNVKVRLTETAFHIEIPEQLQSYMCVYVSVCVCACE